MSKLEFKLPDIGEGVAEGEIVNWLVQEGDTVSENQDMVEVMTDKATVTIGAPKDGKVAERRFKVGDTVPVGSVLVVLDLERGGAGSGTEVKESQKTAAASPKAAGEETAAMAAGDIKEDLPGIAHAGSSQSGAAAAKRPEPRPAESKSTNGSEPRPGQAKPQRASESNYYQEKPLAAPATRKLARELGVDLRRVEPSGGAGRVTREDVERFAKTGATQAERPRGEAYEPEPAAPPAAPPAAEGTEERIPIRGLRKRIFENMARSKHTGAPFAYIDECDVTALQRLRERVKPHAEKAGVKINFLPFIVKAVVAALKRYPHFNSWVDDARQEHVLRKTFDIGIAVSTEAGLIVPVLRRADSLSIVEIAREIERLAQQARDRKTPPQDLGGSSFTITSLGRLGGLVAPPIINYPEVGILGIHEIKRRPVVRGDEIVIGEVMLLSLVSDHRLIDGELAARFAQEVLGLLQEPDRLLIEMS